ncbi:MAG TPA: methyltransferase [Pseudonocardiaceae bacterium]
MIDRAGGVASGPTFPETVTPAGRLAALTDLATPFAVRTLAALRVPDLIEDGVCGLTALAARTGTDAGALGRLLRYLAHRGLLTEPAGDTFALTEVGRLLLDDHPDGHRGYLDADGPAFRMDLAYAGLPHAVRTGGEAYSAVHGRTFWADLAADPVRRRWFDALMAAQQERTAPQVARLHQWERAGHVVDVGGGSGALLAALLHAHPGLRGTVVDRAGAVAAAAERFAREGLSDRADVHAGDFFEPLPPGAGAYVVSRALTDWGDREATAILRRCREAAGGRGRVIVVEVLPTDPHVPHRSPFDLQMLAVVGGRERTLADFAALAGAAGLTVAGTRHGTGGLVVIECAAPGEM